MAPDQKMGRKREESSEDYFLKDEEEEDVKRPRISRQVNYNRCGYIECIELVDFMCHRHLCIRPSPGVNFIVGNNGSGKSALLSALSVTLGSRASVTQRANRLEGLVREGASEARIRLTLNNSEAYPFKPHVIAFKIFVRFMVIESLSRGGLAMLLDATMLALVPTAGCRQRERKRY